MGKQTPGWGSDFVQRSYHSQVASWDLSCHPFDHVYSCIYFLKLYFSECRIQALIPSLLRAFWLSEQTESSLRVGSVPGAARVQIVRSCPRRAASSFTLTVEYASTRCGPCSSDRLCRSFCLIKKNLLNRNRACYNNTL